MVDMVTVCGASMAVSIESLNNRTDYGCARSMTKLMGLLVTAPVLKCAVRVFTGQMLETMFKDIEFILIALLKIFVLTDTLGVTVNIVVKVITLAITGAGEKPF